MDDFEAMNGCSREMMLQADRDFERKYGRTIYGMTDDEKAKLAECGGSHTLVALHSVGDLVKDIAYLPVWMIRRLFTN